MRYWLRRSGMQLLVGALGLFLSALAVSQGSPAATYPLPVVLALATLLATGNLLNPTRVPVLAEASHLVALSALLALGLPPALAVVLLGRLLALAGATLLWRWLSKTAREQAGERVRTLVQSVYAVGAQGLSLITAWGAYSVAGGTLPLRTLGGRQVGPLLLLAAVYGGTRVALEALTLWSRGYPLSRYVGKGRALPLLPGLMILPLAALVGVSYAATGAWSLWPLALLIAAAVAGAHYWQYTQAKLEERAGQLALLRTLGSPPGNRPDLDVLLEMIHTETASTTPLDDFFVALYDPSSNQVGFPMAFERGRRVRYRSRAAGNGLVDYVIRTARPLSIASNVEKAAERLHVELQGQVPQCWLGVPIIAEKRVLGALGLQNFHRTRAYDTSRLDVMVALASHVAVVLQNVRLHGQARQHATELALLNTVSAAVNSTLDLRRVLEIITRSVIGVAACDKSAVFLIDAGEQTVSLTYAQGLSAAYIHASQRLSMADDPRVKVCSERQPLIVPDVHADPKLAGMRELAAAEGVRALVNVPLVAQNAFVGMLAVYYGEPHHVTVEELDLLTTFANQVAAAVANASAHARTDQALARRVEELAALEELGRELTSTLDLQRVIDMVLEHALEATGATYGTVSLVNSQAHSIRIVAHRGYQVPAGVTFPTRRAWGHGVVGRTICEGRTMLVPNVGQDPDYVPTLEGDCGVPLCSELAVPIAAEGQVLGVINLESSLPAAFDRQHAAFVEQLATQAAIAVRNASLFQEVTQGRDLLQAVLDSTRDGILMFDRSGRILLVNPVVAELLARPQERLVGLGLKDLLAEDDPELLKRLGYSEAELAYLISELGSSSVALSKETYTVEQPRQRTVRRIGVPVLGTDNQFLGGMVVLRDVTEEEEAKRMREDVTRMIVHDLRSPLTAILGGLQLTQEILADTQPNMGLAQQAVEVGIRSGDALLSLVNSLLDISRLETGHMRLERAPCELPGIVRNVVTRLSSLAVEGNVRLETAFAGELPLAWADESQIDRVFMNLLDNAIKFTPSGGRVSVDIIPQPGALLCSVSDTGFGIPQDYLEKIFERFVRVQDGRVQRPGTGLGLTFAKLSVEAHGGRIWATSSEGVGSTFYFTLPTVESEVSRS